MLFKDFIIIREALTIVKKLKDRLKDNDEDAYKHLIIGKIKKFNIKKSKHSLDSRDNIRRDKGVPEDVIIKTIEKAYPKIKDNKDTIVIFTYNEKFNMIILFKDTKYKQIVIKTEILQNRNKNTFKYKSTDDAIILEQIGLDYILLD